MPAAKPEGYSRQTLDEAPSRVLAFLAGIGTSASLRTLLASYGYTAAEHQEGWKLLHAATGYEAPPATPPEDRAAADALAAIDAWDEPTFRLARASLSRRFPEQAAFVFAELAPQSGAGALLSVRTFLDRLDVLEGRLPGRAKKGAPQKADLEALRVLGERGITAEERARLRKLLATAESGSPPAADAKKAAAEARAQDGRQEAALVALRAWFDEWAEVARVVVTRRDYLIRLGLAQRRSPSRGEEPGPGPAPNE